MAFYESRIQDLVLVWRPERNGANAALMFALATSRKGKTLANSIPTAHMSVRVRLWNFGSLKINGIHGYSLASVQVRGSMRGAEAIAYWRPLWGHKNVSLGSRLASAVGACMEINKNKLGSQRGIPGSQSGTIRTVIRRAGFPGCGISLANILPQSMLLTAVDFCGPPTRHLSSSTIKFNFRIVGLVFI